MDNLSKAIHIGLEDEIDMGRLLEHLDNPAKMEIDSIYPKVISLWPLKTYNGCRWHWKILQLYTKDFDQYDKAITVDEYIDREKKETLIVTDLDGSKLEVLYDPIKSTLMVGCTFFNDANAMIIARYFYEKAKLHMVKSNGENARYK